MAGCGWGEAGCRAVGAGLEQARTTVEMHGACLLTGSAAWGGGLGRCRKRLKYIDTLTQHMFDQDSHLCAHKNPLSFMYFMGLGSTQQSNALCNLQSGLKMAQKKYSWATRRGRSLNLLMVSGMYLHFT